MLWAAPSSPSLITSFKRKKLDDTFETIERNTRPESSSDIEGNHRSVRDAIVQNGDQMGRVVMRHAFDILGNRIHQESMDAGSRWILSDVLGKPIRSPGIAVSSSIV